MDSFIAINLIGLWIIAILILIVLFSIISRLQRIATQEPQSREHAFSSSTAPDFIAQDLNGNLVTREKYVGREVGFIFVHPTCSYCKNELQYVNEAYVYAQKVDITLIVVSTANIIETRALAIEFSLELPILVSDPEKSNLASQYNLTNGIPAYCFVDKQGFIVSRGILVSGKLAQWQEAWAQAVNNRVDTYSP